MTPPDETPPIRDRYRIRFAKTGLLRWIGHRDLQRLWQRVLRRAGLRLSMSQGFHPKPRINFPSALALGVEGIDEVIEVELAQSITPDELRQRLIDDNQPGLTIGSVELVAEANVGRTGVSPLPGFVKAKLHSSVYEIALPESYNMAESDFCRIDDAITNLKSQTFLSVNRNGKEIVAHVATSLPVFHRRDRVIHLVQVDNDAATLKPTEILDAIGLSDLIEQGATICRTRVILVDQTQPTLLDLDRTPMYPDLLTNKNNTLTDNLFKERI